MAAQSVATVTEITQAKPRRRRSTPSTPPSRPLGSETPRIWTQPLRPLTRKTTLGFEFIEWTEATLGVEMLPYQKWLSIHALELKGPYKNQELRFRTLLVLVGRQCGKSSWALWLVLFFMATGRVQLVLGSAQDTSRALQQWEMAVEFSETTEELCELVARPYGVKRANGQQRLTYTNGAKYQITAANRSAGRGLSVGILLLDELREWRTFGPWSALSNTTRAVFNGLILVTSNAGDDQSVVLNQLRESALAGTNSQVGIFEWSAPDDSQIDDWHAIAQGLPGLGYTWPYESVEAARSTDPPGIFRTEVMCQWVASIDTPIDPMAWAACADPGSSVMAAENKYFSLDVSVDGEHVTLAAAAVGEDGKVRVGVVDAWDEIGACRSDLPELIAEHKPRTFGWFPGGPAAALMADMLNVRRRVEFKTAEVPGICMALAEQVQSRQLVHPNDPLLNAHALGSRKLPAGDGWRFARRGGHADAAYAAAGAVHLARIAKPPVKLQLLVGRSQ